MTASPALLGYVPGTSWLHRASPLPKLAWLVAAVVVILLTFEPAVLVALLVLGAALSVSAGIGRTAARTVIALAPIAASILVLQTLAPVACRDGTCTPVATLGPLTLYQEGLSYALTLVMRLVALELVAVATLATTHPSDLFAALRRVHLPYEVALMAMLSLQLIPQLQQELREVLQAQRARGLRASGIAALGPLLVPVVAGAFDRLTTLVLSLEARGLGAGPRTSYRRVALGPAGSVATVAAVLCGAVGTWLALTRWGVAEASAIALPGSVAVTLVLAAVTVFVLVMAAGLRAIVRD
jgi:energy-coupling factor transport system permease protein